MRLPTTARPALRAFGLTMLAGVMWPAVAAASDPSDGAAEVPPVQYRSALQDYRVFDPDEQAQDWIDANRRVLDLGGWRAYLRKANPGSSSAKDPDIGSLDRADTIPQRRSTLRSINDRAVNNGASDRAKSAADAGDAVTAQPAGDAGMARDRAAKAEPAPALKLARAANALPVRSSIPARIRAADCPRVVTATRIALPGKEAALSDQARADLKALARCLSRRNYIVGAHTDGRGTKAANLALSRERAQAAHDYLLSVGVPASRIRAVGYGEMQPLDTNRTDRGRRRNSRLDFRIVR